MESDSYSKLQDKPLSSPSPSDNTDSGGSDSDFVSAPSSSSPASSTEGEEDTEDPGSGWIGKNGEEWCPTNMETTHFSLPARGVTPGPTHYAIVRVHNMESAFDLFFTEKMIDLLVNMTNLQGRRKMEDWTDIRLLILAGVYRSESTRCLWDDRKGRVIFRATMSLKRFHAISRALRFDDKLQRSACQREDKLAPIRSLWEMWTHRLPLLFNPGKDVTVDEQLVPFRG
ncbi:hypothetical protein ABVT39_020731 [Epinephelus coioides]